MAAITKDTQRNPRVSHSGGIATARLPMAGYTNNGGNNQIYHGSIVMVDVSASPGYCRALAGTPASGDSFGGIAQERQLIDSTLTADGAKKILVARDGIWPFPKAALTQADQGKPCYATTDGDVQSSSTNALWIGTIEEVDATYVWVNIQTAFLRFTSIAS